MRKVAEKLSVLKMTESERAEYSSYLKKLYNDRDELQAALNRGMEKGREEGIETGKTIGREEGKTVGREEGKTIGREEGKKEEKEEIAKKMLSKNHPISDIADLTGLSISEIEKL